METSYKDLKRVNRATLAIIIGFGLLIITISVFLTGKDLPNIIFDWTKQPNTSESATMPNHPNSLQPSEDSTNVDSNEAILDAEYYSDRANTYIASAMEILATGDLEKARFYYYKATNDYTKALEHDPNNIDYLMARADLYKLEGDYPKAIADYSAIIEIDQNDWRVYTNRGLSYSEIEQYPKAIEDFSKSIEMLPNYAVLYQYRSSSYLANGELEKAQQDTNKIIELSESTLED